MKLRSYQEEAVAFLHEKERAALLLDMGLGKTAISLSALTPDHLPALVIAPPRVARSTWPEEARKWRPDLTIASAHSDRTLLDPRTDIVTISNSSLKHALAHASKYRTVIIDELSAFKSRQSQRWKYARALTMKTPHVWGLTGTPAPNGLLDLWSQMYLIDQGEALGKTIGAYRTRYFYPGRQLASGIVTEWHLRPGADKRIHELLEARAISMTTDGRVDLPDLLRNRVEVPLPPAAARVYKDMRRNLVAQVELLGEDTSFSASTAATLTNRLQQVTSGFMYPDVEERTDDTWTELHSEKVKEVRRIVEETGSPVMVAYWYRADLERLRAEFPEARTPDSPSAIEDWNAGRVPVLLVHPASAGHGLNLQHGGHTLVWYQKPWSLELFQQTEKRLHRSGQRSTVVVHDLVSPGTVDEVVSEALLGKSTVQQALLEHLRK